MTTRSSTIRYSSRTLRWFRVLCRYAPYALLMESQSCYFKKCISGLRFLSLWDAVAMNLYLSALLRFLSGSIGVKSKLLSVCLSKLFFFFRLSTIVLEFHSLGNDWFVVFNLRFGVSASPGQKLSSCFFSCLDGNFHCLFLVFFVLSGSTSHFSWPFFFRLRW